MVEWYKVQLRIGDEGAVKIKRAFIDRSYITVERTNWDLVEEMIPQGYYAVYDAIHWGKWIPGEQVASPYRTMYNRSRSYLQKYAIKKAEIAIEVDEESFSMPNPEAERWLLNFSAIQVKLITDAELLMVREVLASGQKNGQTYRETAKQLRSTIGLNDKQYIAWNNYRNTLIKSGIKPAQIEKLTDRYYNKLLKYRAETIALTESHTATNRAWQDSVREAVREGAISDQQYEMYWILTPDDRLCDICAAQSGQTASVVTQDFSPNNPPLHPRCRCTTGVRRKR